MLLWPRRRASPPGPHPLAHLWQVFGREEGHAWLARAPRGLGPSDAEGRSTLVVEEDGEPLPHPHAAHDAIRAEGAGRYSHWGDTLWFSTRDHSDPNTNGRRYAVRDQRGREHALDPTEAGVVVAPPEALPRRLLRRFPLALEWCRGTGLEIGGSAHNSVAGLRCRHVGRRLGWAYLEESLRLTRGHVRHIDLLAEGDALPLADGSVPFVFSSHVLEHFVDPVGALREWDRVLDHGGIMFAVVPHKQRTFDRDRPRTPVDHSLAVHAARDAELRRRADPDAHHSVWLPDDLLALIAACCRAGWFDWEVVAVETRDSLRGNGFSVVCRKHA